MEIRRIYNLLFPPKIKPDIGFSLSEGLSVYMKTASLKTTQRIKQNKMKPAYVREKNTPQNGCTFPNTSFSSPNSFSILDLLIGNLS